MSNTFILVHGAWHGGWAWDFVRKPLEDTGRHVLTPDLPGHGGNPRPLPEVSLQAYVDCIAELVAEQSEPVILVGHSMAGAVISQVAEQYPEKISTLVYLCAFLLTDQQSVMQIMQTDEQAEFGSFLQFNNDQSAAAFAEEALSAALYNSTTADRIDWAKPKLLEYQPLAPLATPISISSERFGKVSRVYIRTSQDKVLSPTVQQGMLDSTTCSQVFTLDADHAPFLSASDELVQILVSL